jgi:predicted polyphosphate/ATP-dependent NAD kinase
MFVLRTKFTEFGLFVRRRIGVIVNPIAGMGGKVGLKGTDGPEALAKARELGAAASSAQRCERALGKLRAVSEAAGEHAVTLVTCRDPMGAEICMATGLATEIIDVPAADGRDTGPLETGSNDTRAAAHAMAERGVDMILFAGGDGTARDIFDVVGATIPILGVPTGVKMHSAIFATSPENAGQVLRVFCGEGGRLEMKEAEVMDLDEEALRDNRVSARLYGYARVPYERNLIQSGKASSGFDDDAALDALAGQIVARMEPGRLYILGCGTTIRRIKRRLGFEGTLLGVDVAIDRRALALDLTQERLLRLVSGGATATIIVSVTGGQGFVFGRGNQQIDADVIRAVGRENIVIVTGASKLLGLDPPCLRVDTGDAALDAEFRGYLPVQTAPGQSLMMKVAA